MPNLGSLFYTLGIDSKQLDADLRAASAKLQNLGVNVDTSTIRASIETAVGTSPIAAKIEFQGIKSSFDTAIAGKQFEVPVQVVQKKLCDSVVAAVSKLVTTTKVVPNKTELRNAVRKALMSAGFEFRVNKVYGVSQTVLTALNGKQFPVRLEVNATKLRNSIATALQSYNGRKVPIEAQKQALLNSIKNALSGERFPIKVIINKAEAQDAVRQALQAAGLQNSGFTASDKRAFDAQSRRLEAEARARAANALAQNRYAAGQRAATRATDDHTRASQSLSDALRGNLNITNLLGSAITQTFSIVALRNFLRQVIEIGGELEKQRMAMNAILDDRGLSETITSKINSLAVKSPFGVLDLNQYAKQLTAYQIPYNELYETTKRMADISAAVGVEMGRIILAYGQVRAAKFLKGTELRQFTEANIPMTDMLAQRFTKLKGEMVSAGQVMEMISNKEVTFEDVKAVLWELTGEGGRFHNMQEELSEGLQAKWKNLGDSLDLMFSDIAEGTKIALIPAAELLTKVADKWSLLSTVIGVGAIAFGVARIGMMAANSALSSGAMSALRRAEADAELERRNLRLAASYRTLTQEEQAALAARGNGGVFGSWNNDLGKRIGGLTQQQFNGLVNSGRVTKSDWERLIALKKLNQAQRDYLDTSGVISHAEQASIRTIGAKKLAWLKCKDVVKSFGSAIGSFLLNPITLVMGAVTAITAIWKKHTEAMARAKEIADALYTRASEAVRNIGTALEGLKAPSEELANSEMLQGVEKLEQAIKDYSPTPIRDINDALQTQDHHLMSVAEKYEALHKKLVEIKNTFDTIKANKLSDAIEESLGDTKAVLGDSIEENLKDLDDAVKDVRSNARRYFSENESSIATLVNDAISDSGRFQKAIKGMTNDYDKFMELVVNYKKYQSFLGDSVKEKVEEARDGSFVHSIGEGIATINPLIFATQRESKAYEKAMAQVEAFATQFYNQIKGRNLSPKAISYSLSEVLNKFEISDETRALVVKKVEEVMNAGFNDGVSRIKLSDDRVTPILVDSMMELSAKSTEAAVQEAVFVWRTKGYNALSDGQKELMKKLYDQAQAQSRLAIEGIVGDMQQYLSENPGQWTLVIETISNQKQGLQDWTRNAIDARGGTGSLNNTTLNIIDRWAKEGDNNQYGVRNAAQQALQSATNDVDAFQTAADKKTEAYKKAVEKLNNIKAALGYLGWGDLQTKDQKSNRHTGGREKDTLAEQLKHRLDNLKKAYAEYEKNLNVMSRTESMNSIKESGLFDELFTGEDAIENFDDYKGQLQKELKKAEASIAGMAETDKRFKGRHDIVLSLRTLLNLEIPRDKAKEELDRAKREIDDVISKTTDKWNLYQDLFSASGDSAWSLKQAWSNPMYLDDAGRELERELQTAKWRKGFTEHIPLTIEVEDARELFGQQNEDLFNLWKAIRERAMSGGRDAAKSEAEAMRKYLNDYKTFYDRRLAIDEEYTRKIAVAREKGNEREAQNLANERDALKMGLEVDAVKQTVDWGSVLGSFGEMFNDQLKPTLEHLTAITKTEGFKNATIEERQKVYDAISELKKSDESWGGRQMFADLAVDLERYQTSMRDLIAAQDRLRNAETNLATAKERLSAAKKDGDKDAIASANTDVDNAQKAFDECADSVNAFSRSAQDASNGVKDSAAKMSKDLSSLAGALSGLKSGSVKSAGEGLMTIDKLFNGGAATKAVEGGVTKLLAGNKATAAIGKAFEGLPMGGIISGILSLMDMMKDGVGPIIGSLLDTILGAVNGILKDMLQPQKMFMMIWEPLSSNLGSILDTVTFGGFSSWTDGNGAAVARAIEKLTVRNELLQNAIENLTESIDGEKNPYKRSKLANDALKLQEEYNANVLKQAAKQASHWGAHSSWNKAWEGLNGAQLNKARDLTGKVNWDGNFWHLTPEEMKVVLSIPEIVDRIQETNYGGELIKYFKDYADQAGKLEEIKEQLYEAATGITFESMYDSFVDALMDMESSAEDFADKFSEYLMRAMLMQTVGEQLSDKLKEFNERYSQAAVDGELDNEQTRKSLEEMWDSIVKQGMEIRDNLAKATGYKGSSSDSKGLSAGISSITEDTADLLASYVNSIRSFVHENNLHIRDCSEGIQQLIRESMPKLTTVAESQLRVQEQIAANTQITAEGVTAIMSILQRNINGANRFHIS